MGILCGHCWLWQWAPIAGYAVAGIGNQIPLRSLPLLAWQLIPIAEIAVAGFGNWCSLLVMQLLVSAIGAHCWLCNCWYRQLAPIADCAIAGFGNWRPLLVMQLLAWQLAPIAGYAIAGFGNWYPLLTNGNWPAIGTHLPTNLYIRL